MSSLDKHFRNQRSLQPQVTTDRDRKRTVRRIKTLRSSPSLFWYEVPTVELPSSEVRPQKHYCIHFVIFPIIQVLLWSSYSCSSVYTKCLFLRGPTLCLTLVRLSCNVFALPLVPYRWLRISQSYFTCRDFRIFDDFN